MAWWQGPFHPQSHHRVILGEYHKHRLTQHMSTNKSHFYLFKRLGFVSAFICLKNNKVALCFKKKKRLLYEFDTGFHEAWNEGTHHAVGGAPPGCLGKMRRAFGSGGTACAKSSLQPIRSSAKGHQTAPGSLPLLQLPATTPANLALSGLVRTAHHVCYPGDLTRPCWFHIPPPTTFQHPLLKLSPVTPF